MNYPTKGGIRIVLLTIVLLISFSVSLTAAENLLSVPLGHRAYPVLQNAEMRGIIPVQHNVRPYSTSKVLKDLRTIEASKDITQQERTIIQEIIAELTTTQDDNSFTSMATYGQYFEHFEEQDINLGIGAKVSTQLTQSLSTLDARDWRNSIGVYVRGDVKDIFSFDLNLERLFDHIDPRPSFKNDFYIDAKGKYDRLWLDGSPYLLFGGTASPELSLSLFGDNLTFRFGSVKRDWGVGSNNLMLSEAANSFNGLETQFTVAPWLRYSFIAGKLGSFALGGLTRGNNTIDQFYNEYHFSDRLHETQYDNNYSAHRIELDLPYNLTVSVFESVVYRRRFELGYLNPLSILFYEQEIVGDLDNMLAGLDAQFLIPKYGRLYAAVATTEMSVINPKRFFTAPRNIMGIQAGADMNLPFLSFTTLTVQYTYLSPFFYTHYPAKEEVNIWEEGERKTYEKVYELSMVNEGRNIGYPLRPNSDEVLITFNTQLKGGWESGLTFKYQGRSAQYGFNIDKYMSYKAGSRYEDKEFRKNLFERAISFEVKAAKTFASFPIRLNASYQVMLESNRGTPLPLKVWDQSINDNKGDVVNYDENLHQSYDKYPVVKYGLSDPWSRWNASHSLSIGVQIWF